MKFRKLITGLALFLVGLLAVVSCTSPQTPTSSTGSTSSTGETLQIGYSAWPGWIPWRVAESEQLFTAENVKAQMKWFDGYLDSINALTAGQLSANCQTLNDTISSIAAGAEQVVVLVNDNSTGNDKIIVRQGINSIADLKGKKIAAEEGTVDHFLLLLGLEKAGLSQKDIQFQPLETGAAAAAFVAGQLDAVGVFAPFTTQALERPGSKALFSSKDFPGAIPDHLVVSRQLLNEKPEAVQALVNTWFKTLDYIAQNKEKALQTMAERAGVSVDEYKEYDTGTRIFSLQDNLKAFAPGQDMKSLPFAAQEISNFLVESGLINQKPNLSQLFDDRFVKAYAEANKN